jgi:hypothetical protein
VLGRQDSERRDNPGWNLASDTHAYSLRMVARLLSRLSNDSTMKKRETLLLFRLIRGSRARRTRRVLVRPNRVLLKAMETIWASGEESANFEAASLIDLPSTHILLPYITRGRTRVLVKRR